MWAQVPAVHLLNGILVRKPCEDLRIQLIVPHSLRKRLFEVTHAGPLTAYLGAERTLLQLKTLYYWPGMTKDIPLANVKSAPRAEVQTSREFYILSGLPTTPDGMKYILVITDYFMKWASAFTLPDAEASINVHESNV